MWVPGGGCGRPVISRGWWRQNDTRACRMGPAGGDARGLYPVHPASPRPCAAAPWPPPPALVSPAVPFSESGAEGCRRRLAAGPSSCLSPWAVPGKLWYVFVECGCTRELLCAPFRRDSPCDTALLLASLSLLAAPGPAQRALLDCGSTEPGLSWRGCSLALGAVLFLSRKQCCMGCTNS